MAEIDGKEIVEDPIWPALRITSMRTRVRPFFQEAQELLLIANL